MPAFSRDGALVLETSVGGVKEVCRQALPLLEGAGKNHTLRLLLRRSCVRSEGAQHIAGLLRMKRSVKLEIDLEGNELGRLGEKYLADALGSGRASPGLSIRLGGNSVGGMHIADALASGSAPQHLTLDLGWNSLGPVAAKRLAESLRSGRAPEHLTLLLPHNRLGEEGAASIADALRSGNSPEHLTLDLACNKLMGAARHFSASLRSRRTPQHLTLMFDGNDVGGAVAVRLLVGCMDGASPGLSLRFKSEEDEAGPFTVSKQQDGEVVVCRREDGAPPSPPDYLECPVALALMRDPVMLRCGHSFDRDSVSKVIFSAMHPHCPLCSHPVLEGDVVTNYNLRAAAEEWLRRHPASQD